MAQCDKADVADAVADYVEGKPVTFHVELTVKDFGSGTGAFRAVAGKRR